MSKKKKVRVAFRKNRQTRTRANDLTRRYEDGDLRGADPASAERVRAKGDLSRHRTIMQEVDETADAVAERRPDGRAGRRPLRVPARPGPPGPRPGIGRRGRRRAAAIRCGVRRVLKNLAIDGRNVVAVGDRVWFRPGGDEQGLIEKVEPRTGTVTRGYRHREHVIVANVDQLLIVSAFAEPELKLPLIDRYLISAEKGGVRPIIVLNKADLVDLADYQWVFGLYTQLGYEVIPCSAADGRGVDRLREVLAARHDRPVGPERGRQDLAAERRPAGAEPPGRRGLQLDPQGEAHDDLRRAAPARPAAATSSTPPASASSSSGTSSPGRSSSTSSSSALTSPSAASPTAPTPTRPTAPSRTPSHCDQIHEGRYESYLKLYHQQPIEGE